MLILGSIDAINQCKELTEIMEELEMIMIDCERTKGGMHTFYMTTKGKQYYLFTQKYRKGVDNYFKNAVTLEKAQNRKKAKGDTAILRTMDKIPMYIRYAEKENGIAALKKTERNKKYA